MQNALELERNNRKAIVDGYQVWLQRTTKKKRGIMWSMPLVAHDALMIAVDWVIDGKLPEGIRHG